MKLKIIITCLLFGSVSAVATAQSQQQRIKEGVRNGEITRTERAQIANQRQDVKLARRVAKADGVVTPAEKQIIAVEKRQASRTIYRTKHNNRRR